MPSPVHLAEAWWQLGNFHFDQIDPKGGPYNLNRSVVAYQNSMQYNKPPIYGVALFVVMNFVVVPLSAIGFRPMSLPGVLRALLPHVIFVGPAIALVAARRARLNTLNAV